MTAETIIAETAKAFGLKPRQVTHGRKRPEVWARQAAAYLMPRFLPGITLTMIAGHLGGLHHTTVMHHQRSAVARLEIPSYRAAFDQAHARLREIEKRERLSPDEIAAILDRLGVQE